MKSSATTAMRMLRVRGVMGICVSSARIGGLS
jgi:hypothetical protein